MMYCFEKYHNFVHGHVFKKGVIFGVGAILKLGFA
jgi:hypothetical protein